MTQNNQVGTVATSIYHTGTHLCVIYHQTAVVRFNEKEIILNTGGYKTVTTKRRMNQAANQYKLDYTVYQKNKLWFVSYKGEDLPFDDDAIVLERW